MYINDEYKDRDRDQYKYKYKDKDKYRLSFKISRSPVATSVYDGLYLVILVVTHVAV